MNLEDLLDESGLQQDEWSLTKPTFGDEGQLQVVGWSGRYNSTKLYILKCTICSQDSELFGTAHFRSPKPSLVRGQVPCGCALFRKWTEDQYTTLCKRAAEKAGNVFVQFKSFPVGQGSKVAQKCPSHGLWETGNVANLLKKYTGCPKCRTDKNTERCAKDYLLSESVVLERLANNLPSNLKFFGWNEVFKGSITKALIHCSHHDTLTTISTQNFLSLTSSRSFKVCANCISENIKETNSISEEDATPLVHQLTTTSNTKFNGFVGDYQGITNTKIKVMCDLHGETSSRLYNNLKNASNPCPVCAIGGSQIYAYVNTILQESLPIAIKFGITGNFNHRLRTQNYANLLEMESLVVFQFPSREDSFAAELECKKTLFCGVVDKNLMIDGHTETTYIHNLDKITDVYKKHGGVKV